MTGISSPLRFVPFARPMVWGGRRLASLLHKRLPSDEPYGESWEISDHPQHDSIVAGGPLAGSSLRSLMRQYPAEILGRDCADQKSFPWLIKFLDANDWLSVQVHPDDVKVLQLWPGEAGKTEAWFILHAEPGSKIYAGLLPGVGPDDFQRALKNGDVAALLHSFTPKPGACVFLPAGTVHALGGGVLLAEVQQTSDATFRLFDWNRVDRAGKPRKLHLDEGLAAIDWQAGPVQPIQVADFGKPFAGPGSVVQPLVDCAYFRLSYVQHARPFILGGGDTMQVLIVLQGQARTASKSLGPGEVWLLPACLKETTFVPAPSLTCLLCTLPRPERHSGA